VDKAIDISGILNLTTPWAEIGSLVIFALVVLSLLKFSVWRKAKKEQL